MRLATRRSMLAAALAGVALGTMPASAAVITVVTAADAVATDGAVSLREAVLSLDAGVDVNADVAGTRAGSYGTSDEIRFVIGAGAKTLALSSPLPPIRRTLLIDGGTQPGFAGVPLITLDGTGAGANADGIVLGVTSGATLVQLVVRNFAGDGLSVHAALLQDGFELGPGGSAAPNPPSEPTSTVTDVVVRDNGRAGVRALGGLDALRLEADGNGEEGVLVDSAALVLLQNAFVHDNLGAGVRALGASDVPYGLRLEGLGGIVRDNAGDGVILGDTTVAQARVVRGFVGDLQIYGNETGIRVRQRDDATYFTGSTILSNNVFNNRGPGLHMSTSRQISLENPDRRTIAGNDFHHNAVTGSPDVCTAQAADQSSSQVVFDGPVSGTDPVVSNMAPDIGPDPQLYPLDYRCYWGADDSDAVTTLAACNNVNNPGPTFEDESGGINNHCLWNGTQCRLAWEFGGTEGTAECDSSRNRTYAYINDITAPGAPATQRGVFATNGAYVRARRNIWGVLGPNSGVFADDTEDARIDADNDCGSISTCP